MEKYLYKDNKKDLPVDQLHEIFQLVGWSDGSESIEMLENFSLPFINSTLVVSAWKGERLIGFVRVISDKIFRSVIYDLAVAPEFQHEGIGSELVMKCIDHFPKSEWLVQTKEYNSRFYKKNGFSKIDDKSDVFLNIPCKLFTAITSKIHEV